MQIDSRLIYAIIGSLITLLLVFVFQLVFLSNSVIPNTVVSAHDNCKDLTAEQNYNSSDSQAYRAPTQVESTSDNSYNEAAPLENSGILESCDDICVESTIDGFITGTGFSKDDDISISSDRAFQVADYLLNDPSKLSEIQNKLGSLQDQNDRDTILYIFSKLPDDQVQQLARDLSSSKNSRDRVDALSLLQSVSNSNIDVQSEIRQIISTENDPKILLQAIKTSQNLNPDLVDSTTQNRLSDLINTSNDDKIRSAALVTKTQIVKNQPEIQNDISTALTSSSKRFTEAGLQALDNILNKQRNKSNSTWHNNLELRQTVQKIANDPNADPYTRVEALNLIQRHYR